MGNWNCISLQGDNGEEKQMLRVQQSLVLFTFKTGRGDAASRTLAHSDQLPSVCTQAYMYVAGHSLKSHTLKKRFSSERAQSNEASVCGTLESLPENKCASCNWPYIRKRRAKVQALSGNSVVIVAQHCERCVLCVLLW